MKIDQFRNIATILIESSVSNKYVTTEVGTIHSIVDEEITKLEHSGVVEQRLPSSQNFETDVRNQLHCLWRIEYQWANVLCPMPCLKEVHATSYGLADHELNLRRSREVPDYGGVLTILPREIPSHLKSLDEKLQTAAKLGVANLEEKTSFLARLWGQIIDVHPFPDGNGRTARFAALLCLRRWGEPFIITPKVRNDPEWKLALDRAIIGDVEKFASILHAKVLEARK